VRLGGRELLEDRRLLAGDVAAGDQLLPPDVLPGAVLGRKWDDQNGDGQQGPSEPGLAGVRIYADLNRDGQLNRGEPQTETQRDNPDTDFDETGLYNLFDVPSGQQWIREVVPAGYRQTFPGNAVAIDPTTDDDLARVEPPLLDLPLQPGETYVVEVSIQILPICIRPYNIDVVSSDPHVKVENLSGVQLNGCGGDTSRFKVAITAEQPPAEFKLLFVDADFGGQLGAIPVLDQPGGTHVVNIPPGGAVDQIDFGNTRVGGGGIEGRKWLDRDADGQPDPDEPGLGGVTIYLDLNRNGQLDRGEPQSRTTDDHPETDFDEGGRYHFAGLQPGDYLVREVVPRHHVQTFPGVGGMVGRSETSSLHPGVAIDLDVTGVDVAVGDVANALSAKVELTVVWPDSCGALIDAASAATVVGNHIVIGLAGHQVGNGCAEVISPETIVVEVPGLAAGSYDVVAVLNETLRDSNQVVATLTAVAPIEVGIPGGHQVTVALDELVSGIDFGNHSTIRPGSIHGTKWLDRNGDGRRGDDEPGLAGVTIWVDLDHNGQHDAGEPSAVSAEDDPNTDADESGRYAIADVPPGLVSVYEVVPRGYRQTYPDPLIWKDELPAIWPVPLPGGHRVEVGSGQAVEGIDFGNQPWTQPSGGVAGTSWQDINGNGRRDDSEPGLPGVVIFADLNHNGRPDNGEPRTRTGLDDPTTRADEAGQYLLADLGPGEFTIRQVVPLGYHPTFPLNASQIVQQESLDLPAGRALSFELIDASGSRADGIPGGELTFRVVWPDGCGTILADSVKAEWVQDTIYVRMSGTQIGDICTLALKSETITVAIDEPPAETYTVTATLWESPSPKGPEAESFVVYAVVSTSRQGAHQVKVIDGETTTGIDFGNQKDSDFPPPEPGGADMNGDGILDVVDIDLLASAIRGHAETGAHDLSGDGHLDRSDLEYLVNDLMQLPMGDANLDGQFNSSDLVKIFQAGEYEDGTADNSGWQEGDWNGDGDFDTSDLVFAFQQGRYEAGRSTNPVAAVAAVDAVWSRKA
jgi:hypothetical protein